MLTVQSRFEYLHGYFKDTVIKDSSNIGFYPLRVNICVVTDVDIVAIKQTSGCGV